MYKSGPSAAGAAQRGRRSQRIGPWPVPCNLACAETHGKEASMSQRSSGSGDEGAREEREREPVPQGLPADSEPWDPRRPPKDRPRHERAEPEDPSDPAEVAAAIAAEAWGEVVELRPGDDVDGDFNGAPELAALEETREGDGADALDEMEGADARALRESEFPNKAETLEDLVAARSQVLAGRLEEARELGIEELVQEALAGSRPAGGDPVVSDDGVLREQLARLDEAIEVLERRSLGIDPATRPR
jgi:hypothetical protein